MAATNFFGGSFFDGGFFGIGLAEVGIGLAIEPPPKLIDFIIQPGIALNFPGFNPRIAYQHDKAEQMEMFGIYSSWRVAA